MGFLGGNKPTPVAAPAPPTKSDAEIQAEANRARELEQLRTMKRGSESTRLTGSRSVLMPEDPTPTGNTRASGRSSSYLFGY